jgi:glucose-6-phosphate 1-dehydrogenase
LRSSDLVFDYAKEFGATALPEAYERLILDVILGDPTLFTRSDMIERAWEIMDPIVAASERPGFEPIIYPRGSWGPRQADELLKPEHDIWRNPEDI